VHYLARSESGLGSGYRLSALRKLLEAGACPNIREYAGQTPLADALEGHFGALAYELLSYGAKLIPADEKYVGQLRSLQKTILEVLSTSSDPIDSGREAVQS